MMFDVVLEESEQAILTSRLLDTVSQGMPRRTRGMDRLGDIKFNDVLLVRNRFGVPVFFSWLMPGEFADIRNKEEEYKPEIKAWLEALSWTDDHRRRF
uniref:Uncharacterized protein n=1 Tax=Zooxanthella nutricula TaxID=1333877 RepID=A0A7S2M7G5_9DINO